MEWKEKLEKDGVVKIERVFAKHEIDALRALTLKALIASHNTIQWKNEIYPALLFDPPGLTKFSKDQRLVEVVKRVLGDNVLQLNNQVYFRLPGDGDQFAWHQDLCFRAPAEKFYNIENGYLQTAIVIDDMDEENGTIEYILGSHKWGNLNLIERGTERGLREFRRKEWKGVKLKAKPGDLILWSVMIVHGSEPNKSSRPRSYYMNGFAKEECVDVSLGFPHYIKDGVVV